MKLREKIKDKLIHLLGGYTAAEYRAQVRLALHSRDIVFKQTEYIAQLMRGIKTVEASLNTIDGMSFDDIKTVGKDSICRQLGEAVYPYAKHFLTEDEKEYIVTVSVQTAENNA